MQSCCRAQACEEVFGPRVAASDLARYRRRGLERLARRMLASVPADALTSTSRVLEIGGGIGALQAEAIVAGAGRGEVVELVGAYRPYAQKLAAELGIERRSTFRVVDLLHPGNGAGHGRENDEGYDGGSGDGSDGGSDGGSGDGCGDGSGGGSGDGNEVGSCDPNGAGWQPAADVQPADVVLMHRVVCCSPDGLELTEVASRLARRVLVLSFPRYTLLARGVARAQDLVFRLLGRSYRIFVRPAEAIVERAEANGLRVVARGHDLVWTFVALERG